MCFRCMDETLNFKPLTRASPFIYLCIYSFLSDDFPFSGLSAENLRRHSSYYFSDFNMLTAFQRIQLRKQSK